MNSYRVTVEFWTADIFGYRQIQRTTEWVDARSEHMACLIVGSQFWADEDLSYLLRVTAVLETN